MADQLTKLRPDRDLQCYFERPSAVAALSETHAGGFTISGRFRQQFDWAVVEWNRDNTIDHPAFRCLPDGDLSGLRLTYEEERVNCMSMDCTLWPTVEWPFLRIWATGSDGVERLYRTPLKDHATPIEGEYRAAEATFELMGEMTPGDYVELAWEAADGTPAYLRHAAYKIGAGETAADITALLAGAINANSSATGVTAIATDATIKLQYSAAAGSNGNRVGVFGSVKGSGTEFWAPDSQMMTGGTSPTKWRIDLDFENLYGQVDPEFTDFRRVPTNSVRKLRWTWAPQQRQEDFRPTDFEVRITEWTVSGSNLSYRIAGPGSWRAEDDDGALQFSGAWSEPVNGNYSGGSIRWTDSARASVSYAYTANCDHVLFLGTRVFRNPSSAGARILIWADGSVRAECLAAAGEEDALVRLELARLPAGEHHIQVSHAGEGGVFYFDFFEIAKPTSELPSFAESPDTTLATDWDTDHSLAIAPERTAWLIHALGFRGRANHYAGAMWFYELIRPGHTYASTEVVFSGEPEFGAVTSVQIGGTRFEHMNLIAGNRATVCKALELAINAGATAVWARAQGEKLMIRARTMGAAGNGTAVATVTVGALTATCAGPLSGGSDGDLERLPWAQGWRTDLSCSPALNRAARDWHRSYFRALRSYGIEPTAGFSMELQHGDPSPEAGIAQRYPDGSAALLNTPALQTNFSPISASFWERTYREMATLMTEAGAQPYLQFGEVQWWYFAAPPGMPFYDGYTKAAFQAAYQKQMRVIRSETARPEDFPEECSHLANLIGEFTDRVIAFVREVHPEARFEVLYPPDVNDTPLNRLVNFPRNQWTGARIANLKTENFTYTGNRNLDKARESLSIPDSAGFPNSQQSHLIGIGDYSTPWQKEWVMALGKGAESIVLFALDQFCLIGYHAPIGFKSRRTRLMGERAAD